MANKKQSFQISDPWYDAYWKDYMTSHEPEYSDSQNIDSWISDEEQAELESAAIDEELSIQNSLKSFRHFRKAREQKVAQLYQVINALTGNCIKDKFSQFLALAILHQQNKVQLSNLVDAIHKGNPKESVEILLHQYTEHQWQCPFSGKTALEQFNIAPSYLGYSQNNPLKSINNALSHLNHYYPDNQSQQLYQDLVRFIQEHASNFELFDLDFHMKRLIHHLLSFFGFKEGDVVQDGCSGTGLLVTEMLYPHNSKPVLNLESSDSLLAQIGQQLQTLKDNSTSQSTYFQKTNPLLGHFGYGESSADFYISCPQMPYKLDPKEIEAASRYSKVSYNGAIARYASDALWVQYALYCLKPAGVAFIVVQDGFLRRSGYDAAVRKYLIEKKLINTVISLHPNHARHSQYNQVSLLILDSEHERNTQDIYFLNLRELPVDLGMMETSTNDKVPNLTEIPFMTAEYKESLLLTLDLDNLDFSKSFKEVAANEYNLSFDFYQGLQHSDAYPDLNNAERAFEEAKFNLNDSLKKFEKSF